MTLVVGDLRQGYFELWWHISVEAGLVRDQDRPLTRWLEMFSGMPEGGVDRERDHKREEDWLETHCSVIWERWPWCCLRPWQWPQEASIQGAAWPERQTEAPLNSSQGRKQQKCETFISYEKQKRKKSGIGRTSEKGRGWEQKWWVSLTLTFFSLTQYKALLV